MIAILSAQDQYLESFIDDRFGRCPWFIKIDTVTNQWKAFPNPGVDHPSGAGVAAAQFVIDQKAEVVISGDFGPHAAKAFQIAMIEMRLFTENIVTVQDAVEQFQSNKLPKFQ
jgi:predicted Fe-Mo cluster-binding NifX family protein